MNPKPTCRGTGIIACWAVIMCSATVTCSLSCREKENLHVAKQDLEILFSDDFERKELGPDWKVQGGDWRIEQGAVHSTRAGNRNLVLTAVKLPENAVITFTMWSNSPDVDIKFNAWGDGGIHDHGDGYTFILGGWHNRISIISKLHEHEASRVEDRSGGWKPYKKYLVEVVRKGGRIEWYLDAELFLQRQDQHPLEPAEGFAYFSFANWQSPVYFDNLEIYKIMDVSK